MKPKYGMKELKKIHRIFGHPTTEKISKLIKDAGEDDPDIMKILIKIHDLCSVCKKHQRNSSKPKVELPGAREVNETVCVDLKPVATPKNKQKTEDGLCTWSTPFPITHLQASASPRKLRLWQMLSLGNGGLGYPSKSSRRNTVKK